MIKTLVVLSGGMDSTALLHLAIHEEGARNVGAVSFNYGQKHGVELVYASEYCASMSIPHEVVDISLLKGTLSNSALTGDFDVPEGHYEDENMKVTVVPNRNMILLAIAAGKAINDGYERIGYAAHKGDHAIYPDCREEFAAAMKECLRLCHYDDGIELWRPFIDFRKEDIASLGTGLGVDWTMTWSCYNGRDLHCGKCATCGERKEAFAISNLVDPTEYEDED